MALLCLVSSASLQASLWEKLVMPGDLIQLHAEYEQDCDKCHQSFDQESQIKLCRDCHEDVDKDIDLQKGFHGRLQQSRNLECRNCHSDHKGRDADIVGLIKPAFDHRKTDFELTGKHQKASCDSCHLKDKKYREAQKGCVACHENDDIHQKTLGEKCQDCHKTDGWKKSEFDHDKTEFVLKDKHQDVSCSACHPDQHYKETPKICHSCHQLQDVHGGIYGNECESCHNEKGWDEVVRDHASDTKFVLKGKHKTTKCHACHTDKTRDKKPLKVCSGCHLSDDIHQGSQGNKCQDCHNEKSWHKEDFDHSKSDFKLSGRHKEIGCHACHTEKKRNNKESELRTCKNCHQEDDFHHGQQGDQCGSCHNTQAWNQKLNFDHDLTRFPLVGLHAVTSCDTCHVDLTYAGTDTGCLSCHQHDDLHELTMGEDCTACHNPNGWERWSFDHDKQTEYELKGQHTEAACSACHNTAVTSLSKIKLSHKCQGCHLTDDLHRGSYGNACERCHQPSSFSDINIK